MVDYNFFDGYKKKKTKSSADVRLFNVLFLLIMMLLAGYIGYNYYLIAEQTIEITQLDQEIQAISSRDDIARITAKKELLDKLTTIVNNMNDANKDINSLSWIDEALLVTIADALPSDVNLTSLSIAGNEVSFNGTGMSKPAIAEFEYNLRKVESFKEMFIHSIQRSDDLSYTFNLNLTLGGDQHENE